jgi:hypothetical protein
MYPHPDFFFSIQIISIDILDGNHGWHGLKTVLPLARISRDNCISHRSSLDHIEASKQHSCIQATIQKPHKTQKGKKKENTKETPNPRSFFIRSSTN